MLEIAVYTFKPANWAKSLITTVLLLGMPLTAWALPEVAQVSSVQSCHFLETVEGSSGYGKNVNWQQLAKISALSHAEKLGASHVVWERLYSVGTFNGVAIAKAYNCTS